VQEVDEEEVLSKLRAMKKVVWRFRKMTRVRDDADERVQRDELDEKYSGGQVESVSQPKLLTVKTGHLELREWERFEMMRATTEV